jgi:hypothetical protein
VVRKSRTTLYISDYGPVFTSLLTSLNTHQEFKDLFLKASFISIFLSYRIFLIRLGDCQFFRISCNFSTANSSFSTQLFSEKLVMVVPSDLEYAEFKSECHKTSYFLD